MILAMDVLRWLAVKAIRGGNTWAGQNVFDSPAQPADLRLAENQAPFIAVYTDDCDIELEGGFEQSNSLGLNSPIVFLIIECAVAAPMTVEDVRENQLTDDDDDADTSPVQLSGTDPALEAQIAFISRQTVQALLQTNNPWSELFRELVTKFVKVEIRRGGPDPERGHTAVRFASRVMRITVEILSEPVMGEGVTAQEHPFWHKFLTTADADPELAEVADIVRAHFTGAPIPSWRVAQKLLTLTRAGVDSLGITPAIIPDEAEAPGFETVDPAKPDGPQYPPVEAGEWDAEFWGPATFPPEEL